MTTPKPQPLGAIATTFILAGSLALLGWAIIGLICIIGAFQ